MTATTLDACAGERENNFDVLRLLGATLVLASHSFVVTRRGRAENRPLAAGHLRRRGLLRDQRLPDRDELAAPAEPARFRGAAGAAHPARAGGDRRALRARARPPGHRPQRFLLLHRSRHAGLRDRQPGLGRHRRLRPSDRPRPARGLRLPPRSRGQRLALDAADRGSRLRPGRVAGPDRTAEPHGGAGRRRLLSRSRSLRAA